MPLMLYTEVIRTRLTYVVDVDILEEAVEKWKDGEGGNWNEEVLDQEDLIHFYGPFATEREADQMDPEQPVFTIDRNKLVTAIN